MLKQLINNPRYLVYAILVHVGFVAILVLSFEWTAKPHRTKPVVDVVDAVVVDEAKVLAEMEKLKQAELKKQRDEEARKRALEKKTQDAKKAREREEKKLADLKKQRVEEQKKLKEEENKRIAETKRTKELEQKKQQESERLAKLKKEQEQLEQKRLQEQKRLEEIEAKKQAEAERQRKLEEEKRRQEAERQLKEQLAAEQRRIDAEREREVQSVVDQYVEIIKQKVTRNWLRPASAHEGLSCTVAVRLIPGGEVLDVRITTSSGDLLFDRSVESAVLKASPLPLPPDRNMFDRFRELQFVFSPEG